MTFMRLWPCGARRAESDLAGGAGKSCSAFSPLLNYNGRPITCHHKHAILCAYGAILE